MDLSSLLSALMTLDPRAALIGAAVLFVVQLLGGSKFDLSGLLKRVLGGGSSPAPAPAPDAPVPVSPPVDTGHPFIDAIVNLFRQHLVSKVAVGEDPVAEGLKVLSQVLPPKA